MISSGPVIGIDPGMRGAVVLVADEVVVGWAADRYVRGKTYLPAEMAAAVLDLVDAARVGGVANARRVVAAIERQQSRPGQGHVGPYTTGYGYGLWLGILAALGTPHHEATPAQRRRGLGLGGAKGKGPVIALVQARLPSLDLTPGRRRMPHDGLADAAAIALSLRGRGLL